MKTAESLVVEVSDNLEKLSPEVHSSKSPPAKKKRFMFNLVETVVSDAPTEKCSHSDEIFSYLKLPVLKKGDSPLRFWEQNETSFPTLSKMARKYLALPATSGSVERLFSVAGSLARSRRARLSISTMEKILCYQQLLLNAKINTA